MIVAGTGHRPPKLGLAYTEYDRRLLTDFVAGELARLDGVTGVISGMAQGFDQALARAAVATSMPFVAALPFHGMESKWPGHSQDQFHELLGKADAIHLVSEGGYRASKFIERDRWMVENSDTILALYDEVERKSGTGATVAWARSRGVPVVNVWGKWTSHAKV